MSKADWYPKFLHAWFQFKMTDFQMPLIMQGNIVEITGMPIAVYHNGAYYMQVNEPANDA